MDISCIMQRKSAWETHSSRIVIPSGAEGSFSLAARGRVFGSEKWETPYRGKTVGGASYKRLGEGGGKRALLLLGMSGDIPEKSANI